MTLLEKDMAMLTRFGLKISFVGFYLKEMPLKLDEQSYFCSEKPGNYLYIPTHTQMTRYIIVLQKMLIIL